MGDFCLFFPDEQRENPEDPQHPIVVPRSQSPDVLKRYDLDVLLDGGAPTFYRIGFDNPAEKPGLFACWRDGSKPDDQQPPQGYQSTQTWLKCAADPKAGVEHGDFWIVFQQQQPQPSDVVRKARFRGREVRLNDGNGWVIPSAEVLPKDFRIDPSSGRMVHKPDSKFAEFCEMAAGYARDLLGGLEEYIEELPGTGVPDKPSHVSRDLYDTYKFACLALGICYRLHWQVINAMPTPLLNERGTVAIVLAAIDIDDIIETSTLQKKNSEIIIPFC